MRKGWFIIPGLQHGDRTVEEQMTGVWDAARDCQGMTVLDLGCAEGLIGREFARAGAVRVHGVDSVAGHIAVAEQVCDDYPMAFTHARLDEFIESWEKLRESVPEAEHRFDIVLSLGVCHKLEQPELGLRFSAAAARRLCLIRAGGNSNDPNVMRSKHWPRNACSIPEVMRDCGFALDKELPGPRNETVQYWRRAA